MTETTEQVVIKVNEEEPAYIKKLSWDNVSYSVKVGKEEKVLISGMTGEVKAGEVVGIMGGSGAGKSTLLNTIAGRIGPGTLKGNILIDGQPRNAGVWNMQYAYVEQDDIMYKYLSVYETLGYSASLRLPASLPKEEKMKRVEKQIANLGLENCRNTNVGDTITRGISGGERKRLSIGVELVTNPQILFLDEPTSGLDAFNALNVIETIKKLAKAENKIVLMTIHQPRTDILELFDKIALLSLGKPVWFGPVQGALDHFEKLGYKLPDKTNPSDYFLDVITPDLRTPESKEKSMLRIEMFWKAYEDLKLTVDPPGELIPVNSKLQWPSTWAVEFIHLLDRNIKEVRRDKIMIAATVGQSLFLGILLGFIFWQIPFNLEGVQSRVGLFFFVTINQTFGIVMPQLSVFPIEREIMKRERAAGSYRSLSAYISKVVSVLPLSFVGTTIIATILYFMTGLVRTVDKFFTWYCILIVHSFASVALGMMIGSGVPSVQVGQIAGPLCIIILMLFGGLFANLDTIPAALRWIQWVSFPAYTNKALNQNEFGGMTGAINGTFIIEDFAYGTPSLWNCVIINIGLAMSSYIIGAILFHRTSAPLQKLK